MKEVCNLMGIRKSRIRAYNSQCDGQVERQNHTVQDMLSAFVSQNREDWDLWVNLAVYTYDGRTARKPVNIDRGITIKYPARQTEYSESVRQHIHSVQKVGQEHLEQKT